MNRIVLFAGVIIVVAGFSYHLGRKQEQLISAATLPADQAKSNPVPANLIPQRDKEWIGHGTRNPLSVDTLNPDTPFVQSQMSAQAGYESAARDLEAALQQIKTLPVRERKGFITGIFTFVGKKYSPAEALVIYSRQGTDVRPDALRALTAKWISGQTPLDEDARYRLQDRIGATSGAKFNLEVELAYVLAASQPSADLKTAWLDAFSQHPSRSEMLLTLSGKMGRDQMEALLNRTTNWTLWEQERVAQSVLTRWAGETPQEAWNYYQAHRNRFNQDLSSNILREWAEADPEAVKGLLGSLQDSAQRQAAAVAVGQALALKNTDQAITWANGLANAEERAAANQSIYEAAPRGIGAMIASENGYPTLKGILPGSPLESSGAQPGDRFVEVRMADGTTHSLYSMDLTAAMNLIRGKPGTELQLRVLRNNESSGRLEEHTVSVIRDQLYFGQP